MKLKDKSFNFDTWIKYYTKYKKFPLLKVPCTKCSKGITLTHDNLTERIKKFGGPENLLKSIECRTCLHSIKKERKALLKRKKKEKLLKKEEILNKTYIYVPKEKEVIILNKNPEYTAKITATECIRPDIYLDNDRSCDNCSIHEHCACPIKRLGKQSPKKREESSTSIKRKN